MKSEPGGFMSVQDHSDARALADVIRHHGVVPEHALPKLLSQSGHRRSPDQVKSLLWTYHFFIPFETRWSACVESPATLEARLSSSGHVESPDGRDLENRILRTLLWRPLMTATEVHNAIALHGEELEDIEIALGESTLFEAEPACWWVDEDEYDPWLADRYASDKEPASGEFETRRAVSEEYEDDDDDNFWEFYEGPEVRQWQIDALNAWIRNHEYGIVEAVTGTGKTLVGILAAARALHYGEAVVVCVPTRVLLTQWADAFRQWMPKARLGELHQHAKDSLDDCDILLTTAQSGSRYALVADDRPTVLIADEVHGYGAPVRQRVLESGFQSRLGLTATLERENDEGVEEVLLPYFDSVVTSYTYADGLRDGVLAPFKIAFIAVPFLPQEQREYEELGSEMGRISHRLKQRGLSAPTEKLWFAKIAMLSKDKSADFADMRLAQKFMSNLGQRKAMQAQAHNKVEALRSLALPLSKATRGLVFTETIDSARAISGMLDDAGVPSYPFDSTYSGPEREQILSLFRDGEVSVLCAPKVLDEGIDVPDADVGVIVAASRSRRQMVQRMGRIVRPNPGGHPSTFFILYMEGTWEDPHQGAHEGFLNEVEPHATEIANFRYDENPSVLSKWLISDR